MKKCKECSCEALPGKSRCQEHLDAHKEREARRREARSAAGKCSICGKAAAIAGGYYLKHCRAHLRALARRRARAREASANSET